MIKMWLKANIIEMQKLSISKQLKYKCTEILLKSGKVWCKL